MPDLLHTGSDFLADSLMAYASRPVTYQQGTLQVQVQAIVGRTLLKLDDGYGGVRMLWTDRDFLIRAADLVLNNQPVTPQRGDLIFDNGVAYEVATYGNNEPHWRWSDVNGKLMRIHTRKVS